MFEELSLFTGSGTRRTSSGGSTATVRYLGQELQLEDRVMCSATPVAADFSSARNQHSMNRIVVDGVNLLQGSGFHIIGSIGTADNPDNVASESPQNSNGIMRPYRGTAGGSVPYSFSFNRNTGDASKIAFSATVGRSATGYQVMNIPLEANLAHFTHYRHSGSGELRRYDQINNGVPSYSNPDPKYIVTVPGTPNWGEIIGPKYTIRVTITGSNSPVGLSFVNAPGLGGGIRDVEFGFQGGLPAQQQRTVSGVIQVFRTDPALFAQPPLVFQSESHNFHQIGRRDGDGWSVRVGDTPGRFMNYGPYTTAVVPGSRTATFRLMVDNYTADNNRILTIDVFDARTGRVVTSRNITRREFTGAMRYQDFNLGFTAAAGQQLEFRTFWHGGSYVRQDSVTVR